MARSQYIVEVDIKGLRRWEVHEIAAGFVMGFCTSGLGWIVFEAFRCQ